MKIHFQQTCLPILNLQKPHFPMKPAINMSSSIQNDMDERMSTKFNGVTEE